MARITRVPTARHENYSAAHLLRKQERTRRSQKTVCIFRKGRRVSADADHRPAAVISRKRATRAYLRTHSSNSITWGQGGFFHAVSVTKAAKLWRGRYTSLLKLHLCPLSAREFIHALGFGHHLADCQSIGTTQIRKRRAPLGE